MFSILGLESFILEEKDAGKALLSHGCLENYPSTNEEILSFTMLRVSFSTLNWQEGEWIFWVSDETKMVIHHLSVTGVWWRKCPIFTKPIYFSSGIQLYYNSIPVASKGGHEANSHQRNENGSDHCHIWDEAVRRAVPSHGNFLFGCLHIGGSPGDSEALMVRIQDRRILGSPSDCMVQSPTCC